MAGFKKGNKNRKSLIAENRFKNSSIKSSHKNLQKKKNQTEQQAPSQIL